MTLSSKKAKILRISEILSGNKRLTDSIEVRCEFRVTTNRRDLMQVEKSKHIVGVFVATLIVFTQFSSLLFAAQSHAMTKREIRENGLVADYFYQEGATNQHGIILLGGSEGGKVMSTQTTYLQDLVNAKCAILSLAYFKEEGLPQSLQSIPLEYFIKATNWLTQQPETRNDGIILIGGSKGAEAALLYASYSKTVKAVIAIVPSAYVFEGIAGRNGKQGSYSSWSYLGKDIPYVPYISSDETWRKAFSGAGLIIVFQEALTDANAKKKAAIPVEKIQGPILLVSAKQDRMWPSQKMSETIIQRLHNNEFPHAHKHLSYDVGHNVIQEAKESWPAILKFMKEHCLSDKSTTLKHSKTKAAGQN